MYLTGSDKADERSINNFGTEINEMFQLSVNSYQEFFVIVNMRFVL